MKSAKLLSVFKLYEDRVLKAHPEAKPERRDTAKAGPWNLLDPEIANHLLYMCRTAQVFVQEEKLPKAYRWLGFLQGIFVCSGIYSVEEVGKHSMPDAT